MGRKNIKNLRILTDTDILELLILFMTYHQINLIQLYLQIS